MLLPILWAPMRPHSTLRVHIIIGASAYFMAYFVNNKPDGSDIPPEDQTEVFVVVEEVTVV